MQTATSLAALTYSCTTCGKLHSTGYLCASQRKARRSAGFYPLRAAVSTPTINLRGTK